MSNNWSRLEDVYRAAIVKDVSFSFHFSEADYSYYFCVNSNAPSECWIGKNHSFDIAVDCVLEHLATLGGIE